MRRLVAGARVTGNDDVSLSSSLIHMWLAPPFPPCTGNSLAQMFATPRRPHSGEAGSQRLGTDAVERQTSLDGESWSPHRPGRGSHGAGTVRLQARVDMGDPRRRGVDERCVGMCVDCAQLDRIALVNTRSSCVCAVARPPFRGPGCRFPSVVNAGGGDALHTQRTRRVGGPLALRLGRLVSAACRRIYSGRAACVCVCVCFASASHGFS